MLTNFVAHHRRIDRLAGRLGILVFVAICLVVRGRGWRTLRKTGVLRQVEARIRHGRGLSRPLQDQYFYHGIRIHL